MRVMWGKEFCLLHLNLASRWVVVHHAPVALPPGTESTFPIAWGGGWAPEPVWKLQRKKLSCSCWELNQNFRDAHPGV